jgi:hypothetical protein
MDRILIRSHATDFLFPRCGPRYCPSRTSHGSAVLTGLSPPQNAVVGSRFQRWRGASGRDYVVSVYPIARCPDYIDAVVLAVDSRTGSVVWAGDSGGGGRPFAGRLAAARREGADEVHLHLLAATPEARRAALADLRA